MACVVVSSFIDRCGGAARSYSKQIKKENGQDLQDQRLRPMHWKLFQKQNRYGTTDEHGWRVGISVFDVHP
jgi:hypothetical protein